MVSLPACRSVGPGFDSWPGQPGDPFAKQRLRKTEQPPYETSALPVCCHDKNTVNPPPPLPKKISKKPNNLLGPVQIRTSRNSGFAALPDLLF